MIPQDYHIHSTFSEDSTASPADICRRAVELGIPEIGFSEHWDVGPYEQSAYYFRYQNWYAELVGLRQEFSGRLIIRAGVEVAEPHLYPQPVADLLSHLPFDYVLGSVHYVGRDFMFDEDFFRASHADEVFEAYFDEVLVMLENADMDILAHLDVPARTAIPILGYQPIRYRQKITSILKRVIDRGLALDVNTAGLRKASKNLMPDPIILRWFAELGGTRLTLGSDAHTANQLGQHLDLAITAIKDAGLSQLTFFQNRIAHQVTI